MMYDITDAGNPKRRILAFSGKTDQHRLCYRLIHRTRALETIAGEETVAFAK